MRALLWMALALAGLVAVITIVGWLLPVGHVASRSLSIARPPADVYALIADVAAYPSWWPDIARVEMLPASPGVVRFREHMSGGPVVMEVVDGNKADAVKATRPPPRGNGAFASLGGTAARLRLAGGGPSASRQCFGKRS